ncbi:Imm75 family immunity protein [Burkholderia sp. Ac-20344]|uniref:Imm75 family immunity protein n=1 Tax=Burkholderia sp. Ac-20344 TaxID=2703890 RepID=UPI001F121EED|nr:Imm75 family immunity protein [Burkholderia sp. Ac-20344]
MEAESRHLWYGIAAGVWQDAARWFSKGKEMGKEATSRVMKPLLPRATPGECFRTYVQAHVLGMRDAEWRRKATQMCLSAWDIGLLPDRAMREQQVERLWQTCEPLTPHRTSTEMASWFMTEVRALVERKRDLLPTVTTFVDDARLEAIDDATDRLIVTTAAGNEALLVHFLPDFTGTPSFGRRLYRLRDWTDELADWVDQMRRARQLTHDEHAEVAAIAGMMRVELAGCRQVSARLHAVQTAAAARRVTAEWGKLAGEIDAQIKAVLVGLRGGARN